MVSLALWLAFASSDLNQGLNQIQAPACRRRLNFDHPGLRMALVGFSFGAFVQARVACEVAARGEASWRICLAGMPSEPVEGGRQYETPTELPDALIVHGEQDERVSLAAVLDWARPQARPVVVVPGADHFFTGKLHILRKLVLSHLTV
jgi:alpha/beta superfamily hydrolase